MRDAALAALARRGPAALRDLPVRLLDTPSRDIGPYVATLRTLPRDERVRTALLWGRFAPPAWTAGAARLLRPSSETELAALVDGVTADGPDGRALVRLLRADATAWADAAAALVARGDWRERPLLVRVLGAVGRPADAPLLDPVRAAGDPRLLDDIACALADLGGAESVPRLAALTGAGYAERVRLAAVRGLGKAGVEAAVAPLDAVVADPAAPGSVRAAAVEALARLRGPGALPLLEEQFLGEDYAVRRAVLLACRDIQDRRAFDLLSRATADGDPAIRRLGLSLLAAR